MKIVTSHSVKTVAKVSLEEQRLLDKLAKGDRNAFWELWTLHQSYLHARCRVWMGGNAFDAEEALSLALLKAWKKLPKHAENITNLKGWLSRLTHNLCVDLHRKQQRSAIGIGNIEENQNLLSTLSPTETNNPEAALLQKEFKNYLYQCIETLPARLRQPLILKYYESMSCKQIGEALCIKQNTVSKRLQEAKSALKPYLSQYFSGLNTFTVQLGFPLSQETRNAVEVNTTGINTTGINTTEINTIEINYTATISCLETLSPAWFNSPQSLMWT